MVDRKIKIMWLPFGGLIIKILELEDEVPYQDYTRIEISMLGLMILVINNDIFSHKIPKEKESSSIEPTQPQ